ncbi:MAG: thiamine pyrophosphate-binding protein [Euryhalocaulis sp.]|uniref:thiamine pyrophosphate-dependent enzyme n=1 Tax=Euryhalocaulis sp. TaxID=2744307 RepID=UPI0017D8AA7E|nr:thiamine pyrophosphate-dependent enzyme [Euryhalocaulis sp.]MBA4801267.1 thiamine pyrophosphate-binding protein [Euryhalocaulis sp.]
MKQTGARHLIDALIAQGCNRIFCVPGESYLAALDALADRKDAIELIVCRHEASAANMAEAHGKLTGRPGVCFVTRGPGATQAAVGVHTAQQDSTPMLLLVGQVRREDEGREAFQELDYNKAFDGIAKLGFEIRDAARVPEQMMRAYAAATNGRPGPVVVAFPEDMLRDEVDAEPAAALVEARSGVSDETAREVAEALSAAEKPLVMVGGPGWSHESAKALHGLAEAFDVPVISAFRAKQIMDNTHSHYVGEAGIGCNPELIARMRECDLLLVIGARLGEMTTQSYDLFETPGGAADKLIHVHPGGEELGRVYRPKLAITARPSAFIAALGKFAPQASDQSEWRKAARADYEKWIAPVPVTGDLNPSEIYAMLSEKLGHEAVLTNGAGNFAAWLHRFYQHRCFPSQLAPTSGAMGYGVPAAIAAKLEYPDRPVIGVAGDGDFMMAVAELATAVRYGINVVFLLFDNGTYGTIRMHQAKTYPGRVSGTELTNPDFKAMAESFGAAGFRVRTTKDFEAAFDKALGCGKPALIHIIQSLEDIAPGKRLSEMES